MSPFMCCKNQYSNIAFSFANSYGMRI